MHSQQRVDEVLGLRLQGHSYQAIAHQTGLAVSLVFKWCKADARTAEAVTTRPLPRTRRKRIATTEAMTKATARRPIKQLLRENRLGGVHIATTSYLAKLARELALVAYVCTGCGNRGEWNGRPMTLELDHTDGDRSNNAIENLRFLCPNCHSQTITYAGKNIRRRR
jgi:predicted RNA-binding Zn-ribbon protein involved in translation (DUF1610 family)